ncbi:hypothetical protein KAR91_66050 [Candidatus Pacearchaeota archaeon]|nr:hypothetical protein [Candidatus Pacearchaeota archaeon]
MNKKYFRKEEDEFCYTKQAIINQMKSEGLRELTVIEAQRDLKSDFFYCKESGEVYEKGEECGKSCESYDPRNGKSGICKHSRNPYMPIDNEITIKLT